MESAFIPTLCVLCVHPVYTAHTDAICENSTATVQVRTKLQEVYAARFVDKKKYVAGFFFFKSKISAACSQKAQSGHCTAIDHTLKLPATGIIHPQKGALCTTCKTQKPLHGSSTFKPDTANSPGHIE